MFKKSKILVAFILSLVLVVPVLAVDDKTINEKATALNVIKILNGDGNGYNLEGQLKRSEAVAFIIRLLGAEDEVKANQAKYANTGFSDVDSQLWYAPYIGYAVKKGIVNGFSNGTYKPDEFVSQKAFTKLVLGVMGYYQDKDFTWDNIFAFAYSEGLYSDNIYTTKKEDNVSYTRGEVVGLLYKALDKLIKNEDQTILQKLVTSGFITPQQAQATGKYIMDEVVADIASIKVLSNKKIIIELTEEIESFDANHIVIKDENGHEMKVVEATHNKQEITVVTDKQTPEKVYTIELWSVVDMNGFKTEVITSNFKGYILEEITSNFFQISKVEAVSKNIVNVYFTQPINQGAAIPLNYDIKRNDEIFIDGSFNNMSAKVIGSADNVISLFLKDKDLDDGVNYSVVASGDISSHYGVKLNNGSGEEFQFIGNHDNNETLEIVSVEPVEKDYIMITFNKDVDPSTATVMSNYELKDTDNERLMSSALGAVMAGEGADKYRMVKVRFLNMVKDHNYMLTIKNVKDIYRQSYISEQQAPFYGYPDADSSLKIDYAYAEDKNTIKVYFNRNVPNTIVSSTFVMNGVSFVAKHFIDSEPRVLTLYTSSSTPLQSGTNYKLSIMGAKNAFNVPYTQTIEYTLSGDVSEFGDINAVECRFIASDTILVKFNKDVHNSNNNASKFKVEYTESDTTKSMTASYINYIDSKTLAVRFSSLDMNLQYNLKISNLVNFSNQFTTSEVSSSIEQ